MEATHEPDQLQGADDATLKRLWRQRIDTERAGKDDPVIIGEDDPIMLKRLPPCWYGRAGAGAVGALPGARAAIITVFVVLVQF
jgi:hypothetical protein